MISDVALAAAFWGGALGALLHVIWPSCSGAKRLPILLVSMLYALPFGLLVLGGAGITWHRVRNVPEIAWGNTLIYKLDTQLRDLGLTSNLCELVPEASNLSHANCYFGRMDGYVAADGLRTVLAGADARLVGIGGLPLSRQGNSVGGKLWLDLPGPALRWYPVTLEYRGLIYVERRDALSTEERWLEGQDFKSYVVLRPGHD